MPLMVSISGIRGIVGETLTPEVAVRYAAAFGTYCRSKSGSEPVVVIGRDGRITGKILTNIISSTLLSTGVHVRALGVCPTPTVQLAVEKGNAAGGISVTASHNPIQWNGMKFVSSSGMFLDAHENSTLWSLASGPPEYSPWNGIGRHTADDTWLQKHLDAVLGLEYIDRDLIRQRKFRIVLDCINAAGGTIVPGMLRSLGCEVIELHCDVSGVFAHTPEPVPENLKELAARVRTEKADLGIAVDPDVDRLVLITEEGIPYGEEYTVASAVKFVLEKEARGQRQEAGGGPAPKVVINLSTTRAVDDIAKSFGAEVFRTPVGEINGASKMKSVGAVIGGEGSGGVIFPRVHLGRDAIVGIGLILQMLAESGGTLSALKAGLPQYSITKGRMDLGRSSPDANMNRLHAAHASKGTVNTDDGLKIDYPDSWVHLRKSNTEPIIRIIAEARTPADAERIVSRFRKEINALME